MSCRKHGTIQVVTAALLLLAGPQSWAQGDNSKAGVGETIVGGNSFYQVYVQDTAGSGVGLYTVTTGPSHPAGSGLNVLYGHGNPGTSFNTIRSYTSGTDYLQGSGKSSINSNVVLGSFGTTAALGTTGVRTTYVLPGLPSTPDALTIVQDVNVNGTTFDNSTVEVTTTVINNGTASVRIGIRYLWDFQVGGDDGPTFKVNKVICSPIVTEAQFPAPGFDSYRIQDNDINAAPPTFEIFGTVNGPSTVVPVPTAPDLLQYVCWPSSFGTAFEYTVDPSLEVAMADSTCSGSGGDSAVLYFWGHSADKAIEIPPSGQATITASLFLTPPQPPPPPGPCVTRNARFWFSHPESGDPNCVTLLKAIQSSCSGGLDLGFLTLPVQPRYDNVTEQGQLALIEALGLYWRSGNLTGEAGGSQSQKLRGAALCKARKQLVRELIAAIGNTDLLGAVPSVCNSNFPPNLVELAQNVAASDDVTAVQNMTSMLREFNNSGLTNDFANGLVECSAEKKSTLKKKGKDPTTQFSCPGANDSCSNAQAIASVPFKAKADTSKYTANFPDSACGTGGPDLVWKIAPPVGAVDRRFTADTGGSNFDTILSVWTGTCEFPIAIICNTSTNGLHDATLSFRTDGTNTFYLVAEGVNGSTGKLRLTVTSP